MGDTLPHIFSSLGLWKCSQMQDITTCKSTIGEINPNSTILAPMLARLAGNKVCAQEKKLMGRYYTKDLIKKVAHIYHRDMTHFSFTLDYCS